MFGTMVGILKEIWNLLIEMSPYLLFGFFIAGILNLIIPREKIYKHLSGNKLSSVIKASLFGVPLPLCSCGVIPVAAYLRKEGAGKSSTVSFLSSTPTTGVDSILATYSLLGPLFAVIRPVAAFFAGIMSGSLTGIFEKKQNAKEIEPPEGNSCNICNSEEPHSHSFSEKIKNVFQYGFIELIDDAGKWILIGVIAGGIIGFLIPGNFIEQYLGNPLLAYPIMLLISIPMYICATGSIPIAAALIIKGMAPGAGLIFLIAGPATNTATLHIWKISGENMNIITGGMKMLPIWLKTFSAILLSMLIIRAIIKNLLIKFIRKNKEIVDMKGNYIVSDMTCQHCVKTIENALKKIQGIENINISLKEKVVQIDGEYDENIVIAAIQKAGYSIEKRKNYEKTDHRN
jgi:uncharacterized membrane protein YraQ (UPF0718 family)/copper chaperone CopZ